MDNIEKPGLQQEKELFAALQADIRRLNEEINALINKTPAKSAIGGKGIVIGSDFPQGTAPPARNEAEVEMEEEELEEKEDRVTMKLPIHAHPKNKMIIIKGQKHSIMAKVTEKNLKPPAAFFKMQRARRKVTNNDTQTQLDPNISEYADSPEILKFYEQRYFLFTRYDEGIKLDRESWFSVTPEIISEYLAQRLSIRRKSVLDAFCGAGGNAIQFAKYFERVYANDIDPTKSQLLDHNSKIYSVRDQINILTNDFLDLKAVKVDLVFVAPPWGGPDYINRPDYSLHEGVTPNITLILEKAFEISDNIVMLLPRNIQLEELADLFGEYFEKHNQKPQRCFMEIEEILITGKPKEIAVYFGNASEITRSAELDAFYRLTNADKSLKDKLRPIIKQQGLRNLIQTFTVNGDSLNPALIGNLV